MLTLDLTCDLLVWRWVYAKIFQSLVVAMTMIEVDVFFNGAVKRAFPKEDHLTQSLGFEAAEKPFDECVAIRTFGWQSNRFCTSRFQMLSEL